jgi:hypothetical protein
LGTPELKFRKCPIFREVNFRRKAAPDLCGQLPSLLRYEQLSMMSAKCAAAQLDDNATLAWLRAQPDGWVEIAVSALARQWPACSSLWRWR